MLLYASSSLLIVVVAVVCVVLFVSSSSLFRRRRPHRCYRCRLRRGFPRRRCPVAASIAAVASIGPLPSRRKAQSPYRLLLLSASASLGASSLGASSLGVITATWSMSSTLLNPRRRSSQRCHHHHHLHWCSMSSSLLVLWRGVGSFLAASVLLLAASSLSALVFLLVASFLSASFSLGVCASMSRVAVAIFSRSVLLKAQSPSISLVVAFLSSLLSSLHLSRRCSQPLLSGVVVVSVPRRYLFVSRGIFFSWCLRSSLFFSVSRLTFSLSSLLRRRHFLSPLCCLLFVFFSSLCCLLYRSVIVTFALLSCFLLFSILLLHRKLKQSFAAF